MVGRGVFLRPLKAAAVGGSTTTTAAPAVEPAGGVGKGRGVESEWRGRMEVIMRDKMNEGMDPDTGARGSKAFGGDGAMPNMREEGTYSNIH